eukprot:719069-Rhodomonas_salina.2
MLTWGAGSVCGGGRGAGRRAPRTDSQVVPSPMYPSMHTLWGVRAGYAVPGTDTAPDMGSPVLTGRSALPESARGRRTCT